ncbi:MAG TPA: YciI family protein [Gaiellaceae bacterium]|nr:YciI family protein [Gaiellaceae bacterium]
MKYLLMLNNSAEQWDEWHRQSVEERQAQREEAIPRWEALLTWVQEQGIEATGLELDDPAKARVVRVRDGETLVTDGPFVETKEVLGGYFLADCKDLDQAIELAQRVPLVGRGSVEIRPLVTN